MNRPVRIVLQPLNKALLAERGTPLQDLLFNEGVEFPCGGRGRCKGCKVRIVSGATPPQPEERLVLSAAELDAGWRLACRARPDTDLELELAQWDAAILSDDSKFEFTPQSGKGVAVDLGTTTIVAQLLDLETGRVLGVQTALNAQARFGADVMSRVEFALQPEGHQKLQSTVREQIGRLLQTLLSNARRQSKTREASAELSPEPLANSFNDPSPDLKHVVVVGNTVMHHLFCGLKVDPLSHFPFEPASPGLQLLSAAELGWELPGNPVVRFLPCLGGFVGSDVLAGALATRLHECSGLSALMDLGTNGEIVLGNRERLLCASTAAGPAFEGARISMGMRAATGAISEVHLRNGKLECHVLGGTAARGLCGSGLVDAVAAALELGWVQPSGRLAGSNSLELLAPVTLTQQDIRELQLAKGAIAAGLRILLEHWGAAAQDLECVYLAGAFGNYINQNSARRIGLLRVPAEKVQAAGNTALLGAKLALFELGRKDGSYPELLARTTHVPLNEHKGFQEAFVEEMSFPQPLG